MTKTKHFISFFIGCIVCLLLLSNVVVRSGSDVRIDNNQQVFLKVDARMPGSVQEKVVAGTEYAVLSVEEARELRRKFGEIETHLPQSYRTTTNDPLEPQGYLTLLQAANAWNITSGSSDLVVAVIDSGYALSHEDLVGRWYTNSGEWGPTTQEGPAPNCTSRGLPLDRSCNNLDDDGNGFVDDWRGWDFAYNDNDVSAGSVSPGGEGVGHGTAVVGMVGATGNNGVGIASINWGATLLPIQVFTDNATATTLELAQGLAYAINQGADIINLSLGSLGSDPVIESLLVDAENAGITVVAAAGNCGGTDFAAKGCSFRGQMLYPATSNRTIAVAGTDLNDQRASFSSQGAMVDLAAPATGPLRTTLYSSVNPSGAYSSSISGTSFASPIVAGSAASIKELWPAANPKDIRAVLVDSALKVSQMSGNIFTQQHGFGRLRPVQAFDLAQRCAGVALREDINCDGKVDLLDLSLLASQWNLARSGRTDINQSGGTDLLDLSLLASRWGQ